MTGAVTPFITNLPTGDHPTEQLAFRGDGWIYWSQGSTTNSGVVGLDNGGGQNQSDIPCQDITLSQNVFSSGNGLLTSGYSPFNTQNPGGTIPAFFNSFPGQVRQGVCDGAILRAQLSNANNIQAFSWGYRNPYAIRFPPKGHPLDGGILAGMDGADERGNRPSDNAPDEIHLGRQNPDGSPDYHGWPDRYGGLPTSQRVYNPIGGPADDLCPAPFDQAACVAALTAAGDIPIRDVLAFPPQQITQPLSNEGADSSFTGIDFVPDVFVGGPVQPGAALYTLEGDFGFSPPNSSNPDQEIGHEVKLIQLQPAAGFAACPEDPELCQQQHSRPGVCNQHQWVQPSDQHQVRPRRMRLCRGLWRGAGQQRGYTFCRRRQWPACPDPWHWRGLEDLPDVGRARRSLWAASAALFLNPFKPVNPRARPAQILFISATEPAYLLQNPMRASRMSGNLNSGGAARDVAL